MNLNLKGKKAIVTGNSKGIGKAITEALREEGVDVPDISRSTSYDLMSFVNMERLFTKFPTCDILINNVGGGGRWGKEIPEDNDTFVWEEVYQKNVNIARDCTMQYINYMLKQKWGRIITISSIYGHEGGGRPYFNMAKASQIAMMKSLSLMPRYATNNITFNSIAPGYVKVSDKEAQEEHAKHCPMQRFIQPNEVANIVTFLCSDLASGINGECIRVDGGLTRSY